MIFADAPPEWIQLFFNAYYRHYRHYYPYDLLQLSSVISFSNAAITDNKTDLKSQVMFFVSHKL